MEIQSNDGNDFDKQQQKINITVEKSNSEDHTEEQKIDPKQITLQYKEKEQALAQDPEHILYLPTIKTGRFSSVDMNMNKEHSLNMINDRSERSLMEKFFKKTEDDRKRDLILTPQKKYTKKILYSICDTTFQAIFAIFAGILYVTNTYYRDDKDAYLKELFFKFFREKIFNIFEILIAVIFAVDYAYQFSQAKNKIQYNLFDLLTIAPAIISIVPQFQTKMGNLMKRFIGVARITRIFRVFRIYKLGKEVGDESYALREYWEIIRKSLVIMSSLFLSIFFCAGLIEALTHMNIGFSLGQNPLTFDESLYFITVTCSTVGYGDYTPQNEVSQFFVMVLIIFIIFVVTKTTSDFNEIQRHTSEYKLPFVGHKKKHILLLGRIDHNMLLKFTKEFYHPDNGINNSTPILLMQPIEPTDEMRFLLKSPFFQSKVFYLVGNPLKVTDIKLAKLTDNKVIIITNQFSKTIEKDDVFSLMATQLIKEQYPKCRIYTQIGYQKNMNWSFWHGWEKVSSVINIKMGLFSVNSFIPGFTTLITNLIMSISEQSHVVKDFSPWKLEYVHGMQQEIFMIKFSDDKNKYYLTRSFQSVCQDIYNKTGVLLIGLKIKNLSLSKNGVDYHDTVLNPLNYSIQPTDLGIILAKNVKQCIRILITPPRNQNEYLSEDQEAQKSFSPFPKLNAKCKSLQDDNISCGKLQFKSYDASKDDLRGQVKGHFIIFGEIEYFEHLVMQLRESTHRSILYVSRNSANEKWHNIQRSHKRLFYIKCQYFSIQELEKTAIADSYHIIILGGQDGSEFQDSRILLLANIIEENFADKNYTVEMTNERNVKYLVQKHLLIKYLFKYLAHHFREDSLKSSYINTLYASSKLFYSSIIEYLMAKTYHIESITDIIQKLVSPNSMINNSDFIENSEISVIQIPNTLANRCTYVQVFDFLINLETPIIPLAIYREKFALDNSQSFVYTNPNPQAPILQGDILIVIGDLDIINVGKFEEGQLSGNRNSKDKVNLTQQDPLKSDFSNLNQVAGDLIDLNEKFVIQNYEKLLECLKSIGVSQEENDLLQQNNQELKDLMTENELLRLKLSEIQLQE